MNKPNKQMINTFKLKQTHIDKDKYIKHIYVKKMEKKLLTDLKYNCSESHYLHVSPMSDLRVSEECSAPLTHQGKQSFWWMSSLSVGVSWGHCLSEP